MSIWAIMGICIVAIFAVIGLVDVILGIADDVKDKYAAFERRKCAIQDTERDRIKNQAKLEVLADVLAECYKSINQCNTYMTNYDETSDSYIECRGKWCGLQEAIGHIGDKFEDIERRML